MNKDKNNIKISTPPIDNLTIPVEEVNMNLSQKVIVTTEDKIRLCLEKYLKDLENKKEWIIPASILITILAVLITADFKNLLFNREFWQALFVLAGIICFIWLIYSLYIRMKSKDIQDIVDEIKLDNINK